MFRAYGLQTHIWNNNLKSALLLAGFPLLLALFIYGLFLLTAGFIGAGGDDLAGPFVWAGDALAQAWPFAIFGAVAWFAIAYVSHQKIIDAAVGARRISRLDDPRTYNLLENLCIARGVPVPALRRIESDALNAFASGLKDGDYSITVTSGLVAALTDEELEAVLAHELTHIRNRDVRLLVIAVIFVGIFSFVGEVLFNGMRGMRGMRWSGGAGRSNARSGSRDGGGGAQAIAILAALAIIAVSYALAVIIRFALSRRREYLADAGAVELTKNPDAMISALRKIAGRGDIPGAPAEIREMFFENAHVAMGNLFATHPPIDKRIDALIAYAGGRDEAPPPARAGGPWG